MTAPDALRAAAAATLLLALLAALPPPTGAAAAASSIALRDPFAAGAPVAFGTAGPLVVEVRDNAVSAASLAATVTTPTDPAGEPVALQLDAVDGAFRGAVGLDASGNATPAGDGRLGVSAGDTVTASYRDAGGALRQSNLTWRPSEAAVLTASTVGSGAAAHVLVRLQDADLDLHPDAADRALVEVRAADGQVRSVCLPETAASSGVFAANATPLADRTPGGGPCRGRTEPAFRGLGREATLQLRYEDLHDPSGAAVAARATATLRRTADASIAFLRADGWTPLGPEGAFRAGETGFVRVEDADAAGQASVPLTLFSTSNPGGLRLDANAIGAGEFVAPVAFSERATDPGRLQVASGDVVAARFTDELDAHGARAELVASAPWLAVPALSVVPTVGQELVPGPAAGTVRLEDPARDASATTRETVQARLVSSRDPVGVPIALLETGPHTGAFLAPFGVDETRSDPAKPAIWAQGGDTVRAVAAALDGGPGASAPVDVAAGVLDDEPPAGAIRAFADEGFQQPTAGPLQGVMRFGVEVRDAAMDRDPSVAETMAVRVGEARSGLEPVETGADARTLAGGLEVRLFETGPGTGVFRDLVPLTCASPPSPGFLSVDCSGQRPWDLLTIQYVVDQPGVKGTVQGLVRWQRSDQPQPGAGLAFVAGPDDTSALPSIAGSDVLHVLVRDDDAVADLTPGLDSILLRVRSGFDPVGITTEASERFGHHGSPLHPDGFRAEVGLCRDACSAGQLRVAASDQVTVEYADASGSDGQPHAVVETVDWRETHSADLASDPEARGAWPGAFVAFGDADLDLDPSREETVEVLARSDSAPEGIAVPLLETTRDNGVFTGRVPFAMAGGSGGLAVADGDRVTVEAVDAADATGRSRVLSTSFPWLEPGSARLSIDLAGNADPASPALAVTLADPDRDATNGTDTVSVLLWSRHGGATRLSLPETGARTGVFSTQLAGGFSAGEPVAAYYRDDLDGAGRTADRAARAVWPGAAPPAGPGDGGDGQPPPGDGGSDTASGAPPAAARPPLSITVHRDGHANVVRWTLPAQAVAGVQVWRTDGGRFTLVATVPAASPAFAAREVRDDAAQAGPGTRYLATSYDGPSETEGFWATAPPDSLLAQATGAPDAPGLPWLWIGVAAGVVLLAGAAAALLLARRRRSPPGPPPSHSSRIR